jgi:hypothetical protein
MISTISFTRAISFQACQLEVPKRLPRKNQGRSFSDKRFVVDATQQIGERIRRYGFVGGTSLSQRSKVVPSVNRTGGDGHLKRRHIGFVTLHIKTFWKR